MVLECIWRIQWLCLQMPCIILAMCWGCSWPGGLHMAADAAVPAGVVLAGLLIIMTGWSWLDPVASLVIAAIIVAGTWGVAGFTRSGAQCRSARS